MKPWFKLYNEILDDPKVQRLEPALFKTWVNLLALACRHDGRLPDMPKIAFILRMGDEEAQTAVAALIDAELIDVNEQCLTMHNWEHRQRSDTSTERVRRYREKNQIDKRDSVSSVSETHVTPLDREGEGEREYTGSSLRSDPPPPRSGEASAFPPGSFEAFWTAYPRKVGKDAASRKFDAIRRSRRVSFDEIMAGLNRYVAAKRSDVDWCHPTTWLSQGRWADEYDADDHRMRPAKTQPGASISQAIDRVFGRSATSNFLHGELDAGDDPYTVIPLQVTYHKR